MLSSWKCTKREAWSSHWKWRKSYNSNIIAVRSPGIKEEPYGYYSSYLRYDSLSLSVYSDQLHMLPILPALPPHGRALNLNKISECDRTYLKWTHSAFSSHIWSRQAQEGNYTSGYPVIRSWKIFHILQLSSVSVASSATDNYPTTLSYRVGCYLLALSTRPINKRWNWKMVNQLPMTLTSFVVTFSSWLVCEFLFSGAFVAALLFTVGVRGHGVRTTAEENLTESNDWDAGWGHAEDIISFQIQFNGNQYFWRRLIDLLGVCYISTSICV